MQENPEVKCGANVVKGKVTYEAVVEAFGLEYVAIDNMLEDIRQAKIVRQ